MGITIKVIDDTSVEGTHRSTPRSGKDSSGRTCNSLALLDPAILRDQFGEYPIVFGIAPGIADDCCEFLQPSYVVVPSDHVDVVYTAVNRSLEEAKDLKRIQVEAAYVSMKTGGIDYMDKTFKSDSHLREYLIGTIAQMSTGYTLPVGFGFDVADGSEFILMDDQQVKDFGTAMFNMINTAYAIYKFNINRVETATILNDVEAIQV